MTAKEFLNQYRESLCEARRIEAEIAELRDRAMSIQGSWHGENYTVTRRREDGAELRYEAMALMPRAHGSNRSMTMVDSYIDKERGRLERAYDRALAVRQQVVAAIEAVPDARYRELLSHRYVSLRTWEWIAETMGVSTKQVHRWHGAALGQLTMNNEQ